jgi:hypothetical protein
LPEEFEGDLTGAVFWGADLRNARFRDVHLGGATITHSWLVDLEVDAFIDHVVINGVDVTAYVNERDPWYPLRTVLRVTDADSVRTGWAALTDAWARTIAEAQQLPADGLHVSVNGEWSFVQTLRHLILATDKWFTVPVLGEPFHPLGLPHASASADDWPALDLAAEPSPAEVLRARAERAARLQAYLAAVADEDLNRTVEVHENGPHLVRECISTIFEEEFWHNRYARRDLAELAKAR